MATDRMKEEKTKILRGKYYEGFYQAERRNKKFF